MTRKTENTPTLPSRPLWRCGFKRRPRNNIVRLAMSCAMPWKDIYTHGGR
jgi:hypothetical protein